MSRIIQTKKNITIKYGMRRQSTESRFLSNQYLVLYLSYRMKITALHNEIQFMYMPYTLCYVN